MNTFIKVEEQSLEAINGGGWLMETGLSLAAAGQADVRNGSLTVTATGGGGSGSAIIGVLELITGGWLMIGGLVEEAFE